MVVSFHALGTNPVFKDSWKSWATILSNWAKHSFNRKLWSPSGPEAFLGCNLERMETTLFSSTLIGVEALLKPVWFQFTPEWIILNLALKNIQLLSKGSRVWTLNSTWSLGFSHHHIKILPCCLRISFSKPLLHLIFISKFGQPGFISQFLSQIINTSFITLHKSNLFQCFISNVCF